MAFVRYKIVAGNRYYQIVHNYRENGKHRQKVIHHLGKHPDLSSAIAAERRAEHRWRFGAARLREYRDLSPRAQTWAAAQRLLPPMWELTEARS